MSDDMISYEDDYGSLADDVLGETGNDGGESSRDPFGSFAPFGEGDSSDEDEPSSFGGFGQPAQKEEDYTTNSKTYSPYLAFDFRRMKKSRWPEGCELLLPETREKVDGEYREALKKQLLSEERMKSMSRRGGISSDDMKSHMGSYTVGSYADVEKKSMGPDLPGGSATWGGVDYFENFDSDSDEDDTKRKKIHTEEDLASPAPKGATFETLGDGSTALIVDEGCRLKLDLSDLVDDAWKKRADIKIEDTGKKRVDTGKKDYGAMYMRRRKLKEPINEYTVTMDIKLLEDAPSGSNGLSLLSTRLFYVHEDVQAVRHSCFLFFFFFFISISLSLFFDLTATSKLSQTENQENQAKRRRSTN
jgi:hypothetical protein